MSEWMAIGIFAGIALIAILIVIIAVVVSVSGAVSTIMNEEEQ